MHLLLLAHCSILLLHKNSLLSHCSLFIVHCSLLSLLPTLLTLLFSAHTADHTAHHAAQWLDKNLQPIETQLLLEIQSCAKSISKSSINDSYNYMQKLRPSFWEKFPEESNFSVNGVMINTTI